ncbi:HlyD family efflux transporter periplasmic adaptor subunit [Pseudoluteimonas lycopersici]|uniref:HlyD family efflux transporter periplasmic adaptor subunit n=1 Tax=Pseudoluteimonas lycopersici TaxID=1324796 RepID=A0A516V3P0_9GAMM|nr:HlyD family efflux transporter periplasmic adaptor subunit [Lysobacter lycopersici]QDQ73150.1 HlyD family efflux transporter periplasmic adaptor subunit [Lysobacter lycopersici]
MTGSRKLASVVLAGMVLALAGCGKADEAGALTERIEPGTLDLSVQAQGELKATKSTPLLIPGPQWTARQLSWTLPDGSRVKAGDLVARFSAVQSEQDLAQALVDLQRNAIARIGKQAELGEQRGQLDVDIAQVASQLAIARRYANAGQIAVSRNTVLDAVQDKQFLETKQGILDWRRGQSNVRGRAELAVLDAQRATYSLNAEQKQSDLQALDLRAPHDGVLVLESDWSGEKPHVGSNLYAGNPLATLPDTASMEVELAIPQVQAQGIRVGNLVELHPSGAPLEKAASKITWIAAAAQTRSRESPVKYLMMKASVPAESVRRYGWIPGQRFDARIVLLHARNAFSVPNLAIDDSGDDTTVEVRSGNDSIVRKVRLGVRGATRSQVLQGLSAGDVVVLDHGARKSALEEDAPDAKADRGDPGDGT